MSEVRAVLPFAMFDAVRTSEEARRAEKLANIYHKSHHMAWDGRQVLSELLAKHGGVRVDPRHRKPLTRVFSILMWGELAAWKISAQLADALEPLEAKMAAASQVFDEARHFYVLHDYLIALGSVPGRPDQHAEAALNLVLDTNSLVCKLSGMQLIFEPTALTIFKQVREGGFDPVLTELLIYFERDEARHVGLGVQVLPGLMAHMWPHEHVRAASFQLRVVGHILRSLRAMRPELRALGIDPRQVLEAGILKHKHYSDQVSAQRPQMRPFMEMGMRSIVALCEILFPRGDGSARTRLREAVRAVRHGARFSSSLPTATPR